MIKNREELLSHGFVEGRRKALDIMERALSAVNPLDAVRKYVKLEGNLLFVGEKCFDLERVRNIYAIGAGKATYLQAKGLEEILGDRITDGFVAVKKGQTGRLTRIRMAESSHPIPDHTSLEAAQEITRLADKAEKGDLVFCLMSGGVSSQVVYPVPTISLEDKIHMNRLLVHSGADVTEIMTVRRHLSRIKGGRLAERILPATIVTLTVSDEKTDSMEWNTDWTSGDSSTLADSVWVLKKYGLWDKTPENVRKYLSTPAPGKETPKVFADVPIHHFMIVRVRELWEAAVKRAEEIGLKPVLLTTLMNGESREVGRTLASIAREVHLSGNPVEPPCVLIAAGETSVRIEGGSHGEGGANQELAAGASLVLSWDDPIAVCALDTDGTDGPTPLAGALTDGSTVGRASWEGLDIFRGLMEHNISEPLREVGDAVYTGQTGTNVNDLVLIIILEKSP
jgi:glycerate 2-kinase